jgi:hypothetical protein
MKNRNCNLFWLIVVIFLFGCTKPDLTKYVQLTAESPEPFTLTFQISDRQTLIVDRFWSVTAFATDTILIGASGTDTVNIYLIILEGDQVVYIESRQVLPGEYLELKYFEK